MRIRPATASDFLAFYGRLPRRSLRALAGEDNGEVVGLAGYYPSGDAMAVFTDYREGLSKRNIVRGARAVMDLAKRAGMDLVACRAHNNDALAHFGFQPDPDNEVWRWRAS